MNGIHDMGGMHGLGPVEIEKSEPVFHDKWEGRACALTLAVGFLGEWNLDQARYAREQMPPADYLATSYYEHWLFGLEKLLHDTSLVRREELEARLRSRRRRPVRSSAAQGARAPGVAAVLAALRTSRSHKVVADVTSRFRPGDRVVARNVHPTGHTRLPRYARGKRGVIALDHGTWVFPDVHAMEGRRVPQHCYSVRFEARELWGPQAPARDAVFLDLFEGYLDPG